MTGFGALTYADARALYNDARRAIRSPGRLTLWAFYVLGIVGFSLVRTFLHRRQPVTPQPGDSASADLFMSAVLVLLAIAFATGLGAIGIFRTRAEARFIIASPISAPLAIAYLQVRELIFRAPRFSFSLIYSVLVFAPARLGALAIVADLLVLCALFAAVVAVIMPRRLLGGAAATACQIGGGVVAVIVALPALRVAVSQFGASLPPGMSAALIAYLPAWHPGRVLLEPNALWVLAALAVAAAATAMLASAGRDAYPELYALSTARIDAVERWRARRSGAASAEVTVASGTRRVTPAGAWAPGGVLIFGWKSLVEFRRQKQWTYIGGGAVGWLVLGFVAGRVVGGDDEMFGAFVSLSINFVLIVSFTASTSLAAEIRRPLFWLADTPLYERLCALALTQVWRPIVSIELVALGLSAGGGGVLELVFATLGLPALVTLLAGVGFAAYALFPSAADVRGPVMALRFIVSSVMVVPPIVLFGFAATVTGATIPALLAAALLALLEGAAFLGVAAWRLDGRVDRLTA